MSDVGSGVAQSGSHVADISPLASGVEFHVPWVRGVFADRKASAVSVYVGLMDPTGLPCNVMLRLYDASDQQLGHFGPVPLSGSGFQTQLSVQLTGARAEYFTVVGDNTAVPIGIDTVTFTVSALADPDFALTTDTGTLSVAPGLSATTNVTIHRLGGSTGAINLETLYLPAGVSAVFEPNPATGDSTVMTLTADSTAADVDFPGAAVRIRGTPIDSTAGALPQLADIYVMVRPDFTIVPEQSPFDMAYHGVAGVSVRSRPDAPYTATIALSVSAPDGVSAAITPDTISFDNEGGVWKDANVAIDIADDYPFQDFTVTVLGTDGATGETVSGVVSVHRIAGAVLNFSPVSGWTPYRLQPGTEVTLHGDGFVPDAQVRFGNQMLDLATPTFVSADHSEMRVTVPRLAMPGPITIVEPNGQFSTAQSFTVMSYRSVNGFAFENFTCSGVSWGTVQALFGRDRMYLPWPLSFIPNPLAWEFVGIADLSLGGGQCFGISRVDDELMHYAAGIAAYPQQANATYQSIWNIDGPGYPGLDIHDYVHVQHTAQLSAEGLHNIVAEVTAHLLGDAQTQIYDEIAGALSGGEFPLVSIQDGDAHTMVAYDLEDNPAGPGNYFINVYDSNRPYTSDEDTNADLHASSVAVSRIRIYQDYTGNYSYSYDMGNRTWGGPLHELVVTTDDVIPAVPTMPDSLTGLLTFITGSSAHVTQLSDAAGHNLLLADGSENSNPATRRRMSRDGFLPMAAPAPLRSTLPKETAPGCRPSRGSAPAAIPPR